MPDLPDFTWIDRPEQLAEVAAVLDTAPWIALDTESNSMFVYRERMCLLQLNAGGRLFALDTLALTGPPGDGPSTALEALRPALERTDRILYLHGGEYDCAVLRRDFAIRLGGVWDSQQAAQLLGWERTGYGASVETVCGVILDKAYTQYDWGIRPLDPNALIYALDDVVHLPKVGEHLHELIKLADLEEEMSIACHAVIDAPWGGGFDPGGFWRIKGVRELPSHCLGVLAALWTWRDGVARVQDRPPGRILNGEALLAVARSAPTNFQLLKRTGMKGWILSEHGEELVELIKVARTDPPALPPRPKHREVTKEEEDRETRMKDWRRVEAQQRNVPLMVVLPAKALEYLKQHGAGQLEAAPQLGPKRLARYGDKLRDLCAAR